MRLDQNGEAWGIQDLNSINRTMAAGKLLENNKSAEFQTEDEDGSQKSGIGLSKWSIYCSRIKPPVPSSKNAEAFLIYSADFRYSSGDRPVERLNT